MTSQEIQEQLAVQTEHIKEKKKLVLEDLSKVEPAVKDAQQGLCRMNDRFKCILLGGTAGTCTLWYCMIFLLS